jgi:hypothetical protein
MTGRRRLVVVGWWFHERAPDAWPRPQALVGRWRRREREAVLRHLRAGARLVGYERASYCRFACGDGAMGRAYLTDGTFVWPSGLAHYVEHHAVRLPESFVAHAVAHGGAAIAELPAVRPGLYDPAPWLRWARAQGACLDLAGWEVPDADARRRMRDQLGRSRPGMLVLCHPRTREVVLAQRDGSLLVHRLRADGPPPRRLAGWQAWPSAPSAP